MDEKRFIQLLSSSYVSSNNSNPTQKRVFISYAREDIAAAQKLYALLRDAGSEPWLDGECILPGQKWKVAIKDAIASSNYFIALLSKHSVEERGYVLRELREALDVLDEFPPNQIFLIPVRLGDCNISEHRLREIQSVDLFPDWKGGIDKVLRAMNIDINLTKGDTTEISKAKLKLSEVYWDKLFTLINQKKCIPFIGPWCSSFQDENGESWIPPSRQIAKEWIGEYSYPFDNSDYRDTIEERSYLTEDSYYLSRVAQFLAIEMADENFPKYKLSGYLDKIDLPDFSLPKYNHTTYAILADLNLPIYLTTNYDLLMERALESRGKDPVSEFCSWNDGLLKIRSFDRPTKYKPDQRTPLVYHILGHIKKPESMVLTEKDYFDFVIYLNQEDEKKVLPTMIRQELPLSSLLFIGYSLYDINFRAIFQGALSFLGRKSRTISIAVQIPPVLSDDKKEKVIRYLDQYTKHMFEVYPYWGSTTAFVTEFRERWEKFEIANKNRIPSVVRS